MSVHPTQRVASLLTRVSTTSDRDSEVAEYGSEGAPSGGTLPTGQALASGQVAIVKRGDAPDAAQAVYVTTDGGTSWAPLATGQGLTRSGLSWVAGARGKPGINADINSGTASIRMIADPDFEVTGVNGTSALSTFNAEGGVTFTTAGADGDEMILTPHLDANQTAWTQWTWGTDKSVRWSCDIETGANITNAIIWAGLKLTSTEVTATDDDQVFVRYEDDVNDGEWQAINSIAGVDVATDTGIVVAVDTRYRIDIVVSASRVASTYINGTLVDVSEALTDAVDLIPYVGVAADGAAAAKAINIYGAAISRVTG